MATIKKQQGDFGESLAKNYLVARGFFVLAEKYYTRHGEIDLIALDKALYEVVFVEVKTRSSTFFGWPEQAVDKKKRLKMLRSAHVFLRERYPKSCPKYRFDIISILINRMTRKAQIQHFKNIEMN